MPFDGSGNYVLPGAPNFPAVSNTPIVAAYYNAVLSDLSSALSATLLRNGSVAMTGNLNLNSYGLQNVGSAAMLGLLQTAASAAVAGAGFRLPHGVAPSTPTNGDVWTTTTGLYAYINGVTYRILGAPTQIQTIATTSGTTATLSGLSTNYSELFISFNGVSPAVGASNLTMTVSADGVSWSSPPLSLVFSVAYTTFINGVVRITFYSSSQSVMQSNLTATTTAAPTSPSLLSITAPVSGLINVTGGMDYARWQWSSGTTFDAGSITAYAM